MFGDRFATLFDVGLDVAAGHYAMGFGARLRWLYGEGLRTADWDEPSEWASLLRYLTYVRDAPDVRATVAAGELGGVELGHGTIIDGYMAGIDVDHRHLGLELGVESRRYGGEAVIDDLVQPRIVGARGYRYRAYGLARVEIGASAVADFQAPRTGGDPGSMNPPIDPPMDPMDSPTDAMDGLAGMDRTAVVLAGVDASVGFTSRDGRLSGTLYGDAVVASVTAAGIHAGAIGSVTLGRTALRVQGEARLGTGRYIPGWMGPLYERNRRQLTDAGSQLDVAGAGGLGGLGGRFEIGLTDPRWGDVEAWYATRPGLGRVMSLRLAAPYFRDVQGAAWAAAEDSGGGTVWLMAGELRARLPGRWFARAEVARLQRAAGAAMTPLWLASVAVGASWQPDRP